MANLFDADGQQRQVVIRIPRFEIGEHFTVYTIEIGLGQFKWSVNRRFSEFASLHDELVSQHKLRDLDLPAKRIFGNQSVTFVQRRQKGLEEYLRKVLKNYSRPPPPLSRFTLWDKYEVHGITATMSAYVLGMANSQSAVSGEWRQQLPFEFSVLQVHAINARVTSPAPTNDLEHMKFDVGHIMNFVTRLPAVRIWGSSTHFGTSSIVMNQLPYDLSVFKEIESLQLIQVDLTRLKGLQQLKQTLTKLAVHGTLQTLKELLLQDVIDSDLGQDSTLVQCWSRIIEADFADNSLRAIDESVKLLPNVQRLNLSGNQIPAITNLEHLSELQKLNLSKNGITDLLNLNVKLGNIKELILVENRLTSLLGLSRVYSLQTLDVSKNQISEIIEVCHIGRLPCLENLRLSENPVTLVPDYRTKVFEQFGERAPELRLDGKRGSQKELDTAAVLMALQKARNGASVAVSTPARARPKPDRLNSPRPSVDSANSPRTIQDGTNSPRTIQDGTNSPRTIQDGANSPRPIQDGTNSPRTIQDGTNSSRTIQDDTNSPRPIQNDTNSQRPIQDDIKDASPATRPSSLVPEKGPAGATGETMNREKMESLRSRGGKQWLVEYNQMMDQPRADRPTDPPSVRQLTLDRQPSRPEPEEATPGVGVRFETRVELALGRLLHRSAPPLTDCAPTLPLLSAAAEAALLDGRAPNSGDVIGAADEAGGSVPLGGAVAVTEGGRLLVLVRQSDARLGLGLNLEAANLAQVVRGFRGLYLRLEERFAGPDGVAVLLTMDAAVTDRLAALISRHSGLAVVSLEGQRQRQIAEYVSAQEVGLGPSGAPFYCLALFRSAGLRQLVSLAVSRRRLHLLDERMAALPPPLGASAAAKGFTALGTYAQRHLRLPGREEEEESVGEDPEAERDGSFFRFPATVPLRGRAERPGALDELRFDFDSAEQRRNFLAALQDLQEEEGTDSPKDSPDSSKERTGGDEKGRNFAFERWDALSAAVKHRVALSPSAACPLRRLIDMDSAGLERFFARHVQPEMPPEPPEEPEELLAVMWAFWLHYRSKAPEALACVFLTNRGIYVVFDPSANAAQGSEEESLAFKSLTRRRSVDDAEEDAPWSVNVFSFRLSALVCVYVGPFNQYLRLSGHSADQDFTLVTRDFRLTENLLNYLRKLFRGVVGGSVASSWSSGSGDGALDVYRNSRPSSVEQLGRAEIRFPNDEILSELLYVVEEAVQPSEQLSGLSSSPHGAILDSSPSLLYYLLLESLSIDLVDYVRCCTADHLMAVLIVAGSGHLVLLRQNVSQYPIPDFARGPPEVGQFSVLEVRPLRCLSQLTLSSCDRRLLTLSFAPAGPAAPVRSSPPASPGLVEPPRAIGDPVHVTAYIQNPRDVDKLVKLLRAAWKEHTGASQELPVHRS